jgi:hypothetical protein
MLYFFELDQRRAWGKAMPAEKFTSYYRFSVFELHPATGELLGASAR